MKSLLKRQCLAHSQPMLESADPFFDIYTKTYVPVEQAPVNMTNYDQIGPKTFLS
jgi:hypothetical protein